MPVTAAPKAGRGERIRTSGLYVPNPDATLQKSRYRFFILKRINNLAQGFHSFLSVSDGFFCADLAQFWHSASVGASLGLASTQAKTPWLHMAPNASSDAMAAPTLPRLVTKAHAAEIFGVCVKTVDNYIAQGLLPRPVAFASREYWHPEVFADFLERTFLLAGNAAQVDTPVDSVPRQTADAVQNHTTPPRFRSAESTASLRQRMRQEAKLKSCNV